MQESSPESDTLSPSTLSELEKIAVTVLPSLLTLLIGLARARFGVRGGDKILAELSAHMNAQAQSPKTPRSSKASADSDATAIV